MISKTELEHKVRVVIYKGTLKKRRERTAEMFRTSFSFSKMDEARQSQMNKTTMAASKNASLKNAPSGTKNGVHFNVLNQRYIGDSKFR